MSTLEAVDEAPAIASRDAPIRQNRLVRIAPHLLVWTLLLVPAIRSMARGWRPLSDDATIAIGAWRSLSLHPPLIGQITSAAGGANASDPGPLEYWLLAPFAHLDPGQGVLLGSAILCAVILSITLHILWKNVGTSATIIFSLVIADLAITSPTPFLDPVWNNAFGFFWFIGISRCRIRHRPGQPQVLSASPLYGFGRCRLQLALSAVRCVLACRSGNLWVVHQETVGSPLGLVVGRGSGPLLGWAALSTVL